MIFFLLCVSGVFSDTPPSQGYLHLHIHIPISPAQLTGYAQSQGNPNQHDNSWQKPWQHMSNYEWNGPGHTHVESYPAPVYELPASSQPGNPFQRPAKPPSSFENSVPSYPVEPQRPNQPFNPPPTSQPINLGERYAPTTLWHVGIYIKLFTPYMQMCGGSLVKSDIVLTAGHCFCNEDADLLDASLFAVAAGKLLRSWDSETESFTQHSDVRDLKLPPEFQGTPTNFEYDIAIVFLSKKIDYTLRVKPICINFDLGLEQNLLSSGNLGILAGWSFSANTPQSQLQQLKIIKLKYMDTQECLARTDPDFLKFITSDKICAGDGTTGICLNDVGGGLAYTSGRTPYLIGVASAPRDNCNPRAIPRFTRVRAHRKFLEKNVPGIGACGDKV